MGTKFLSKKMWKLKKVHGEHYRQLIGMSLKEYEMTLCFFLWAKKRGSALAALPQP
jgi:hypothetical protein